MRSLETAVALAPQDSDAWYFLGRAAYEANRFEKAIDSFDHGLRAGGRQYRLYGGLGLAYEAMAQYNSAERAYRQAVVLGGSAYWPSFALGRFLVKQGRAEESLPFFEAASRLSPATPEICFEFGRALYQLGRTEKALHVLKECLPTQDCRVYILLAKVLRQCGEPGAADRRLAEWRRCSTALN
jgi:anaphase-promoting complex subunit 3